MNNRYHKYTPYEKLKTVVLGSFYTADYFEFIDTPSIRNPLQQIATEVNEDLNYYNFPSAPCLTPSVDDDSHPSRHLAPFHEK